MTSRALSIAIGAAALLGVSACGSSDGDGSSPQTTVAQLNGTNFVTIAPVLTSTTVTTVAGGAGAGGVVAGEQQYTVVAGDIVVRIAKRYGITATALAEYNQWPEGFNHPINPGDIIRIPPGAQAPTETAATVVPTDATVPSATTTTLPLEAGTGGTYTVVSGDYLSGIAQKTGTTVEGIVAANGWTDANQVIIPGQQIKLPAKAG